MFANTHQLILLKDLNDTNQSTVIPNYSVLLTVLRNLTVFYQLGVNIFFFFESNLLCTFTQSFTVENNVLLLYNFPHPR